jgi:thiosulfate dehydrogenase [quinone] large subunit
VAAPGRPPAQSASQRLRRSVVPAWALLPLRIFLGVTFVYAGLDKLLYPNFFNADSGGSIQAQFAIFERVSPLAPLVHLAEPFAVPLGVLIALGEIAVGLGTLTGLAYRLSALGGAFISLVFFLTASWSTHPYYFGNDLPYMFGWLTVALAGHGDLFVIRIARSAPAAAADMRRRSLIQVGSLAALTLFVGGGAALVRFIRNEPPETGTGAGPSPGPSTAPSPIATSAPGPSPTPQASPASTAAAPGIAIARISDVQGAGARRFTVPLTAPSPLPAGDPAVVVALADGTFVAYDALCTHEGCRVSYSTSSGDLVCPCHGARFDASDHGAVVAGPATQALLELPLIVNQQDGTIALAIS